MRSSCGDPEFAVHARIEVDISLALRCKYCTSCNFLALYLQEKYPLLGKQALSCIDCKILDQSLQDLAHLATGLPLIKCLFSWQESCMSCSAFLAMHLHVEFSYMQDHLCFFLWIYSVHLRWWVTLRILLRVCVYKLNGRFAMWICPNHQIYGRNYAPNLIRQRSGTASLAASS